MWRPTAFPAVMVDGRSQILKFAAGRSRASMRCGAARSAPRSLWAAPSDCRFYRSRTAGLADAGQPGRAGLGGPCRCGRRPLPRHSPWLKAIPTCGNVCAKLRVRRIPGGTTTRRMTARQPSTAKPSRKLASAIRCRRVTWAGLATDESAPQAATRWRAVYPRPREGASGLKRRSE